MVCMIMYGLHDYVWFDYVWFDYDKYRSNQKKKLLSPESFQKFREPLACMDVVTLAIL